MNYSYVKKRIKIIYFLIFFIFSTNLSAINKQDFENLIDILNRNYEQYEITKASNILIINENLINQFISEFKEVAIDEKIAFFNDELGNLTPIRANALLKVISSDLKENNSFEKLGSDNLILVKEFFNKVIPISNEDDREINDNGYTIALIVNFSSTDLSNEIIKTVSDVSNANNNSKALASNVIYNISNINSELLLEIDTEQSQRLIKETVKELNNSIIKNETDEINNNERFSKKNPLTAVSETILLSSNSISDQITTEIKKNNSSNKENISLRLIEKTLDTKNWTNDKDENIVRNKNKFTEKIYPIGFKNFNKEKINLAEKIIYSSDNKTSEVLLESIINEIDKNNNNFITLNKNSLDKLKKTFLTTRVKKTNLIRSQNEAEAVLDSLYNNEKISNILLTNNLLLPAYANIQKNNFENLENVSPN
jgi:hypothetical protein